MERNRPDWVGVVLESLRAVDIQEIPDFNRGVSRGSRLMRPSGVEIDAGNPILVPLARHDQFSVGN